MAVLTVLGVSGCGQTTYVYGTPVITFTSKAGPFADYRLYVDSITLTRTDGLVVALLTYPEQVDLASLFDHSELMGAPAVPIGEYVAAEITFDYGTTYPPDINVNVNGNAAAVDYLATDPVTGKPDLGSTSATSLAGTTLTVLVKFDPNHPLDIYYGQSTPVQFDFDLEASNIVDLADYNAGADTSPNLTVNPIVTADSAPVYDKPIRVRGVLVDIQPDQLGCNAGCFIMNIHPVLDQYYTLGAINVQTSASTYFNVDIEGQAPVITNNQAQGLAALQALPENEVVAVYGTIAPYSVNGTNIGVTPTFNATSVIAGSALESTIQSHVQGIVAAKTGNLFVIRGATYIPPDEQVYAAAYSPYVPTLSNNASVVVDSTTRVAVDGTSSPAPTLSSVSIGDTVDISGQPNSDFGVTTNYLTLDTTLAGGTGVYSGAPAEPGEIRILTTQAQGTLTSATAPSGTTPGSATIDLLQLGLYPTAAFQFTGTGSTASSYTVSTGSVDLSSTAPGTLVELTGYPASFGSAPPDFLASAASLPASSESQLILEWWSTPYTGTATPFASTTSTSLTLNPSDPLLSRHVIVTGPQTTDLSSLPAYPVISVANAPAGSLRLAIGGPLVTLTAAILYDEYNFSSLSDFESQLTTFAGDSVTYDKLVAVGSYDATTNTFNATRITLTAQ